MTEPLPAGKKRRWWLWMALTLVLLVVAAGLLFPVVPISNPTLKRVTARSGVTAIHGALEQYYAEYGQLPAGDVREVFATLRGGNPRKIVFFEAAPRSYDAQGVFLDPWGTPYRMNTADPKFPVYSCGKDRIDNGGAEGSDDLASWR